MVESRKEGGEKGKLVVHLLVIMLGVTSWSIMNGLWVELPILVAHLPEGWTLPSLLTIISQFGNLGPLTFLLLTWLFPKTKLETPISIGVVIALSVCAMLYAFLWTETATIGGVHFSVAILVLTLCQSIFAATSSMSYLAFMSHLKARYISSIFIGQGLSGLIPAFIAIGQGAGDVRCLTYSNNSKDDYSSWTNYSTGTTNDTTLIAVSIEPEFSVRVFFVALFALGCLSFLSLMFLVCHPYCTTEYVNTDEEENCQLLVRTDRPVPETPLAKTDIQHIFSYTMKEDTDSSKDDTCITNQCSGSENKQTPGVILASRDLDKTCAQERLTKSEEKNHNVQPPQDSTTQDRHRNSLGNLPSSDNTHVVCKTHHQGTLNSNIIYQSRHQQGVTSQETPKVEGQTDMLPPFHVNPERDEFADATGQMTEPTDRMTSWYLLFLLIWINVLQTSYVLAIQVYSSLPYGLRIYNGVTKAENIVDPVACVVTLFVTAQRTRVISGLTLLGTLFAAYIITVAAMSPHPFLVNETMGGVLVIAAWVMCTVLMVYSKVSIASVMRAQGRQSLIWTGASSQLGALIGAILAYVMINQLDLFKDGPWC